MPVLERGLTFIPTPRVNNNINYILRDIKRFTCNIRLRIHFERCTTTRIPEVTNTLCRNESTKQNTLKHLSNYKLPSEWTPPLLSAGKEHRKLICSILQVPYRTNKVHNGKPNITSQQEQLLRNLSNDNTIIISKADKGSTTVLWNRTDYFHEAYRQLGDASFYQKIPSSFTVDNYDNMSCILKDMLNSGQINKQQFNYLLCPTHTIKERKFYLMPKIHKPISKWTDGKIPPGRPIVSDVGSESYYTAQLISELLSPEPPTLNTYIKNSYHFVSMIKEQPINNGCYLVTADIDSLYTNTTVQTCTEIIETYLNTRFTSNVTDNIMKLVAVNLNCNDFTVNGDHFLQVSGVAMGKAFAPHLANMYLAPFDEKATNGFRHKPKLFKRFIDDIFFVWENSLESK